MRPRPHSSDRSIHNRFDQELQKLRDESLYRDLTRETPDFSSNDYLGLAHNGELIEAVAGAVRSSDRVASTGPRLLSGNTPEWEALEEEFSRFAGTESALYFSSGYAANVGMLSAILKPEDTVYSDALNHASLIDGIRLSGANKVIFPHLDLEFLETALGKHDGPSGRFIVVESLFSMDGDRAPINDLMTLAEGYGAGLIVDEAHAVGVFGSQGRGLIPDPLRSSELLVAAVYTCGKALASPGAFVAGARGLRPFLINKARTFVFSTALPPYVAAQVSAALELVARADNTRMRLEERALRLRTGLSDRGVNIGPGDSQIVPVILGSNEDALTAAEQLNEAGFTLRPIRPPTVPAGTARLRLTVTADTSIASLDALVDAIASVKR